MKGSDNTIWTKKNPTKKDWRHNSVLSGTNVKGMKKIARKRARRKLRLWDDVMFPFKKMFCHYDINDFK